MIRVNLLTVPPGGRRRRDWVPPEQRAAVVGLLMLLFTGLALAGWWWELGREGRAIDGAIVARQTELTRLRGAAKLVDQATARRAELLERLGLIDRLRRTQRDPVELLQTVSESVPDGLWLLELRQQDDTVQIEGRAQTLTAITDFVERLQTSGRFRRPVDIITTSMETVQDTSVVRFAVRGTAIHPPAAAASQSGQ